MMLENDQDKAGLNAELISGQVYGPHPGKSYPEIYYYVHSMSACWNNINYVDVTYLERARFVRGPRGTYLE